LLCILVIAFTLVVATGMRTTQRSYTTAGTTGVDGLFTNIRQEIEPLGPELIDLMNTTLTEIAQNSFDPVWDTIRYANGKLDEINGVLGSADGVLNETHEIFQGLRQVFTALKQYQDQGYVSNVPDSSTVPDVTGSTSSALTDARSQIAELSQQIANLTNDLQATVESVNMNSPELASVNNLIRDTTTTILDTVDSTESSYNNTNWVEKVNEYWFKYGGLFNAIRIPVMIVFTLAPIILFALWYLGAFSGRHKCMLIGFWYAAGICWLLMILGVVHIILYIPVHDLCRNRNTHVTTVLDQFVFDGETDYAGKFGLTSPPEAVAAVNTAVRLFMSDPDVILKCKGEETIVQNLKLDLPTIFDLQNRYNNATQQVRDAVNQINIASQIESTQPSFRLMNETVRDVSANLTSYNSTFQNYSAQRTSLVGDYDPENFWNATTEAESQTHLDAINARTSVEPTNPRVYAYNNVSDFDPNSIPQNPTFTPSEQSEYSGRRDALVQLVQVNETVKNVTTHVNQWGVFEQNLTGVLRRADGILINSSSIISDAWDRVNATLSLPATVTDSILGYLNPAVARAIEMARLQNLGKCAFIGTFTENGLDRGLCVQIGQAAGGVGVCVVLLCFLWLFMWPIILSSKAHFAGFTKDADSDFFEVELSTTKQ